jgi:hypothetical protein
MHPKGKGYENWKWMELVQDLITGRLY